ncbi:MAG: class I tRNA ligase family protein [Enterocloster clostridioformis]
MVKQQWFVKMEEMAKPAIEALKNGSLTFVPESFGKAYLHWLEGSPRLVHHVQSARVGTGSGTLITAGECGKLPWLPEKRPHGCPKWRGCTLIKAGWGYPGYLVSSALWPFSTLGWPEKTEDLDYFYPTDVLVNQHMTLFSSGSSVWCSPAWSRPEASVPHRA